MTDILTPDEQHLLATLKSEPRVTALVERLCGELSECRDLLRGFWETMGMSEESVRQAASDGFPEYAETRERVLRQIGVAA